MPELANTQRAEPPARLIKAASNNPSNRNIDSNPKQEDALDLTRLRNLHREDQEKLKLAIDKDRNLYNFSWTDIFKPTTLFNKTLSRALYPVTSTFISKIQAAGNLTKIKNTGTPIEEELVQTKDGHQLSIWLAKNPNPEARTKIYFHGNASHIASFTEEAIEDYTQGNNICLMSYRGYSGNPGYPTEEGLIDDTNSTLDFLIKKHGIKIESMDFIAHSLGSAVVLNSLAKRTESNPSEQYGELLLMSPFKSIRDMIGAKTKIIPQFVINWFTNIWNNIEALNKLKNKISKLTILHGKADELIPIKHSQDLYQEALKLGMNAELIELDNIGHNDINRKIVLSGIQAKGDGATPISGKGK